MLSDRHPVVLELNFRSLLMSNRGRCIKPVDISSNNSELSGLIDTAVFAPGDRSVMSGDNEWQIFAEDTISKDSCYGNFQAWDLCSIPSVSDYVELGCRALQAWKLDALLQSLL